jgi:hypothetical protein
MVVISLENNPSPERLSSIGEFIRSFLPEGNTQKPPERKQTIKVTSPTGNCIDVPFTKKKIDPRPTHLSRPSRQTPQRG